MSILKWENILSNFGFESSRFKVFKININLSAKNADAPELLGHLGHTAPAKIPKYLQKTSHSSNCSLILSIENSLYLVCQICFNPFKNQPNQQLRKPQILALNTIRSFNPRQKNLQKLACRASSLVEPS